MNASGEQPRVSSAARNKARRLALQALYQWQMTATDAAELIAQFEADRDMFRGTDRAYFEELIHQVTSRVEAIDQAYLPSLGEDRKQTEIDPVEKAALRIATYELAHRLDVPFKVVINEAVALTKKFGADQSHSFVNGVLDKVARHLRAVEHPEGSGTLPGWGKNS